MICLCRGDAAEIRGLFIDTNRSVRVDSLLDNQNQGSNQTTLYRNDLLSLWEIPICIEKKMEPNDRTEKTTGVSAHSITQVQREQVVFGMNGLISYCHLVVSSCTAPSRQSLLCQVFSFSLHTNADFTHLRTRLYYQFVINH